MEHGYSYVNILLISVYSKGWSRWKETDRPVLLPMLQTGRNSKDALNLEWSVVKTVTWKHCTVAHRYFHTVRSKNFLIYFILTFSRMAYTLSKEETYCFALKSRQPFFTPKATFLLHCILFNPLNSALLKVRLCLRWYFYLLWWNFFDLS